MLITVENISIRFGERLVLSGFSAQFLPGEVTALVGPSGSGKSSLLAVMAGILRPDEGRASIYVDSQTSNPTSPDPSQIAWIPQGSNALGTRSVLDNVAIGALSGGATIDEAAGRARGALSQVGLGLFADQSARSLSGGELQRVAIARALASGKPAIFADEPSANLDAANTRAIADVLFNLRDDAIVVVATHDPILVAAASRVVDLRASHAN